MLKILVGLALLAVLEVYVLLKVAAVLGVWWTLLLLILPGFFGGRLVLRQLRTAFPAALAEMAVGRPPDRMADAVLIAVAGVLLIIPGVVGDVAALLLLIPFLRVLVRPLVLRGLKSRGPQGWMFSAGNGGFRMASFRTGPMGHPPGAQQQEPEARAVEIEGEGSGRWPGQRRDPFERRAPRNNPEGPADPQP